MVNLDQFISDILDCLGWPYVSPGGTGKDCSRSGIDCSGLLVRAYAMQGAKLFHGSNYIARHELVGNPEQLKSAAQLRVGMAVFKWSKTGEPPKYVGDGMGNFHHIGVVTSLHPLTITHASSTKGKVVQDTSISKWSHCGLLKAVQYKTDYREEKSMRYKVIAASGETVNLRRSASTQSDVLTKIRVGAEVEGSAVTEGWTRIMHGGLTGYMMSKFLDPVAEEQSKSLEERVRLLEERVAALEGGVG